MAIIRRGDGKEIFKSDLLKKETKSESDLAEKVCSFLAGDGWDIYQEVQFGRAGRRADIMARRGDYIWAVEVKKSMTFDVIAQARDWQFWTHGALIAVPEIETKSGGRGRALARRVCEDMGIGIIEVGYLSARMTLAPRLNRDNKGVIHKWILPLLHEDLKGWGAKAGNSDSDFWSPFKATCRDAIIYVEKHEGVSMKELMEKIQHHYSSDACARSAFSKWIMLGKVKGLRIEYDGKRDRVYTTKEDSL